MDKQVGSRASLIGLPGWRLMDLSEVDEQIGVAHTNAVISPGRSAGPGMRVVVDRGKELANELISFQRHHRRLRRSLLGWPPPETLSGGEESLGASYAQSEQFLLVYDFCRCSGKGCDLCRL